MDLKALLGLRPKADTIGKTSWVHAPRDSLGAEVRLPSFDGIGPPQDSASRLWPIADAMAEEAR
jgi:hypothetical protein